MDIAVGSELGLRQTHNGDGYISDVPAPDVCFFGVADGFGMAERSTPAAVTALILVRDYLRRSPTWDAQGQARSEESVRTVLSAALEHANAHLYARAGSHEDFVGSASSLTVILIVDQRAFIGHVGDARAYLLRFGRLELLTTDDALFADTQAGVGAKTSLPALPCAPGVLWRSLGTQKKLGAGVAHMTLLAGDQIVLCTDGVHRCISSDEMCDIMLESQTASEVVSRLLAITKMRGGLDNATLITARDLLGSPSPMLSPRKPARRFLWFVAFGAVVMIVFFCLFSRMQG